MKATGNQTYLASSPTTNRKQTDAFLPAVKQQNKGYCVKFILSKYSTFVVSAIKVFSSK
jgi:hypothetical protein